MPELPEVETSRRAVDRALRGKRITSVLPDRDDHIVFDRASPDQFRKAIEGAKVLGSGRKGKYFWLELDRRPWPVFHLGMTGHVEIRKPGGKFTRPWGDRKHSDTHAAILPFCRLRMITQDGTEIAVTDPRRFGRIRLAKDPASEPPISRLGEDPLRGLPKARDLHQILKRRRAPIKAVLLDQKVFAGVGNWIADETLFQAKISPHRLAASLTLPEITAIRTKLQSILDHAVKVRADYTRFPRSWLFHTRWGKDETAKTHRGHSLTYDTIGGRTTAWVPTVQR